MVASSRLKIGLRVVGSHGPLISNPNSNMSRYVQEKVSGTVIEAIGVHEWDVLLDYYGKTKKVTSRPPKLVADETGIPLN